MMVYGIGNSIILPNYKKEILFDLRKTLVLLLKEDGMYYIWKDQIPTQVDPTI